MIPHSAVHSFGPRACWAWCATREIVQFPLQCHRRVVLHGGDGDVCDVCELCVFRGDFVVLSEFYYYY